MRRETDRAVYVYGLSSPGLPRRLSVLGRRLQCLDIGGIDAIIERSRTPDRSLEDVQFQHRLVSRLTARTPSLLPARFGSVVTEDALRSLVSERHVEIEDALRLVRNCEQMTVRVFGPAADERAIDPQSASGTAYLARRRERAHQRPPEAEIIRRELGALARAERAEAGERGAPARRLSPRGEAPGLPVPPAGLRLANPAGAVCRHRHRPVAGVRVCTGAVLMVSKTRSTRRKPQARRKAKPAARSIARVEVQELESIRAEVERLARRTAPPRWNPIPRM